MFTLIRNYRVLGHFECELDPLRLANLKESFSKIKSVRAVSTGAACFPLLCVLSVRCYEWVVLQGRASHENRQHYLRDLDPMSYGFSEEDLDRDFFVGDDLPGPPVRTLRDIIQQLKDTYCRYVGVQFMHLHDPYKKKWIQAKVRISGCKA